MEKKLYFLLDDREGEGGIMDLSGCMAWIDGDLSSNYPEAEKLPENELPQYTLTPVWMTDEEYEALPEQ